ncbi:MAG TPA: hypothetical protein VFL86_04290 [Burkholderiaceae bacterium]|nr:hypothetical protein [Burkholderiaceae bacterium]
MTLLIRELERTESRVLGALRCVDASTGAGIETPLQVQVAGARIRRNRSGLYVLVQADTPALLALHEAAFDAPPALPAVGSVAFTASIEDPSGRYLPRLATLALPRDPLPANAALPGSLFRAIDIPMYPAGVAPLGANWAVLRVSVRDGASGDALGGALLRVRSGGQVLALGLSDWRGEALVPVPGVPATTWSEDPDAVVVSEIAAQLEGAFDALTGTRVSAAQVQAGQAPHTLPRVDPQDLETRFALLPNATQALQLASGRSQSVTLTLALP